jgi:hypothetical protein
MLLMLARLAAVQPKQEILTAQGLAATGLHQVLLAHQ